MYLFVWYDFWKQKRVFNYMALRAVGLARGKMFAVRWGLKLYRVFQEETSVFWAVALTVIMRKKSSISE